MDHKREANAEVAKAYMKTMVVSYLLQVNYFSKWNERFSLPLLRYLMSIPLAFPLKTLVVAERPYATDIHGSVSSALSFDKHKTSVTPSVNGLAKDISTSTNVKYAEAVEWLAESWRYMGSGVVYLNCMYTEGFDSPFSLDEIVPFQHLLRNLILINCVFSQADTDVVTMGVPAETVVNRAMQNLGSWRARVKVFKLRNPAVFSRLPLSDRVSPCFTFGRPGTSKALARAIERSRDYPLLDIDSFVGCDLPAMASLTAEVDKTLAASGNFAREAEDAYKKIEAAARPPQLTEAYEALAKALVSFRDKVVTEVVAHSVQMSADQTGKTGKPTQWGSKSPWNKPPPSVGRSTRMTTVSGDESTEVPLKTPDSRTSLPPTLSEGPPEIPLGPVGGSSDVEPDKPKPRKKATIVVPRKIALDDRSSADVKSMVYYLTMNGHSNSPLIGRLRASLNQDEVTDRDVVRLCFHAERDRNKGIPAHLALGLEDNEIRESTYVFKELQKIVNSLKV